MMSVPPEPAAAVDAPPEPTSRERVRLTGPLRTLLSWYLPLNMGVFVWSAIPAVMLPLQIEAIDPANKLANLGVVATTGALAAMIAQPIAGAISDRTRTRLGRRAPWMVAGSLIGGLGLLGMAAANGLVQIAIAWTIAQIAYNFVLGPMTAILPDRVPPRARGTFASVAGAALMIGSIGGQGLGAAFAQRLGTGYVVIAGITILVVTLFVVFNPDRSSTKQTNPPLRLGEFIRAFWVSPVAHPDFFWAFTGRLLLYTGFFSVTGFNLYLLSDYVGLGKDAAAMVPLLGLLSLVGMLPAVIVSGPLSDRLGRRKVFVFISSVLVTIGLVLPWIMPTLGGMQLMALVSGLGFGAFQSVDQALMTEVLPSADSYAKDLGVVNIAATLPQTLSPAVGAAIAGAFSYAGLFPFGMVLSVLGALAVFMIKGVR